MGGRHRWVSLPESFQVGCVHTNDRWMLSTSPPPLQPEPKQSQAAVSMTSSLVVSPPASSVAFQPDKVISDNDLRCLLFCKCTDCVHDCCSAARDHRLAAVSAMPKGPLASPPPMTLDTSPLIVRSDSQYDDSCPQPAMKRVQSTSLSLQCKQALRHGSFEIIPALYKRILQ